MIEKNLEYNFLSIEIELDKCKIKIGVFYKSPSLSNDDFIQFIGDKLNRYENFILVGDANIDIHRKDNIEKRYTDMILEEGYEIINGYNPTRVTDSTASLIDHVITDLNYKYVFKCEVLFNGISDHYSIHTTVDIKKNNEKQNEKIILKKMNYSPLLW